jgi:nucleoside 2-deoxyribosyltransferase
MWLKGSDQVISSARIQENILICLKDKENHSVQEVKSHLADIGIDDYTEGQFSGSINTLLRNGSIKKIDRGIYAIKEGTENMKKCFVVSPIGDPNSDVRNNADKLFRYIVKPVCEDCEFEAIRVDQLNDANSITQTIIDKLESADLVIADVSGHNPNVFYEIGFRTRTKKPIIHLKSKGENLPFDVNTIRTFEYDLTDLDNVEETKSRLVQTVRTFNFFDPDETEIEKEDVDGVLASVTPLLYQILDTVLELRSDLKSNNSETIATVVKAMQSVQPQVSNDTALQTQLINSLMQNPDAIMKLYELSNQFPASEK